METLVQDVRFGFRQFIRRPGFTAIALRHASDSRMRLQVTADRTANKHFARSVNRGNRGRPRETWLVLVAVSDVESDAAAGRSGGRPSADGRKQARLGPRSEAAHPANE